MVGLSLPQNIYFFSIKKIYYSKDVSRARLIEIRFVKINSTIFKKVK